MNATSSPGPAHGSPDGEPARAPHTAGLLDSSVACFLDALASPAATPGAGPAAAWTCAVAAALIEMAAAIEVRTKGTAGSHAAATVRRDRAHQLRQHALALADADAAAYQAVLTARREPRGHDRATRFREALSAAVDPPLAIAETASELAQLASTTAEQARGGVRGEATATAILAEAATAACIPMLQLNLANNANDPRLTRGTQLADDAAQHRTRAAGTIRMPQAKP